MTLVHDLANYYMEGRYAVLTELMQMHQRDGLTTLESKYFIRYLESDSEGVKKGETGV